MAQPVPYTWRAGLGYVPPPWVNETVQLQSCVPVQNCPPNCVHIGQNYQYFYPPHHPFMYPQPNPLPVAIPVATKKTDKKEKPKEKSKSPPPPPSKAAETVVSAASTQLSGAPAQAPASKKTAAATAPTVRHPNPNQPPSLRAGANYMFPPEHTKLHIFNKTSRVWMPHNQGVKFDFKIFTASTSFTPAMVIDNILGKIGSDPKEWAVTEVIERGDGNWAKGSTIEYTSDKAKGSLASMGWTKKRGVELPPVWLVVHKVVVKAVK